MSKRKNSSIDLSSKKRQKTTLWNELMNNYGDIWVSASAIKNYMLNDPLIDWLHLYGSRNKDIIRKQNTYQPDPFIKKLCDMGIDFENEVINALYEKFNDNIRKVLTDFNDLSIDKMQDTIEYMKTGVPLIEQAVLYNKKNKTFGVADLLIRSDWINKLFNKNLISDVEINIPCKFSEAYHYRVIDIKLSAVKLCSNSYKIRNSNRMPAYKGQLTIYNAALGDIQEYIPNSAYILSKRYINGKNIFLWDQFELMAEIDFIDFDRQYIEKTNKAINWIRNLKTNGMNWTINPPSVPELYPNMSNHYDSPYRAMKQKIANEIKEITQIWMIGPKQRQIAHASNKLKWDDCNSEILGIGHTTRANIIDQIIDTNKNDELFLPNKIKNNLENWQNYHEIDDFFIDFETINTDFVNVEYPDKIMIFMIGIWYKNEYKSFVATKINLESEYNIITECINYIYANSLKPRLFHWSHAEPSSLSKANIRHNESWSKFIDNLKWIDMYKIFINEPITIKGCFSYGLKDIASSMLNHGMISIKWNGTISNGMNAMMQSIKFYETNDDNIMNAIKEYNKIDCIVLNEIISFLRKKIDI